MAAAFAHRRKTLESHPCALPRAEGRFYRQQAGKRSTCPRSTFIRQYLVTPDVTSGSGVPGMTRPHMHVPIRGDGGSRTRVQKHLLTCYYTLIP